MNTLARHIELLLAEHECVIVPGLGGFISRYMPSKRVEEDNVFLPPRCIIAFNPQLTINDGLLVQSYMEERSMSYVEACTIVEHEVNDLINRLHERGGVTLEHVGILHCAFNGTYSFSPFDDEAFSAEFYGLSKFEIHALKTRPQTIITSHTPIAPSPNNRIRRHTLRRKRFTGVWQTVVLIIVVLGCFLMPTPIRNTDVEPNNLARLLPQELFESYVHRSVAMTPVEMVGKSITHPVVDIEVEQEPEIQISEEPSPSIQDSEVVNTSVARYHVIVASMATEQAAYEMANQLKDKGYANAKAIIGDGRMRVSINSLQTEAEAYRYIVSLQNAGIFKDAWVLTR